MPQSVDVRYLISIHALAKRATYLYLHSEPATGISIHALAKRATYSNYKLFDADFISIHALAKRATRITDCVKYVNAYFNPRPRKEGDSKFIQ